MNNQGLIIAISGGPGTGKSSLVKKLVKYYHAKAFFEGEENDFPVEVQEGIKTGTNQLAIRLYFRNKTFVQYLEAVKLKEKGRLVFLDNFWLVNEVCCREFLSDAFERELMTNVCVLDRHIFPKPDLIISLKASAEKIKEFIEGRGRSFEINNNFLKRYTVIHEKHDDYLKSRPLSEVLFIDRSERDFNNSLDFAWLIDLIENKLSVLKKP